MSYLVTRTVSFFDSTPWAANVTLENEAGYVNRIVDRVPKWLLGVAQKWAPFQFSVRLVRRAKDYSGFAVGRYSYWFPVLYRGRKPIILMDTEYRSAPGLLDRAACSRATFIACFTREEGRRAAEYMRLPIEKFRTVLMAYQPADIFPSEDGDYIFAGGTQGRDWDTLFKAVDGLPYPVRLYTNARFTSLPSNVSVHWVSRREFYEACAKSACVVLPLQPEPFRLPGTTTWISTMACGKPLIVTDPYGAPDYLRQGISGFCCNYRDWKSVRAYIVRLMEDKELRLSVGREAKLEARRFSPEAFREQILALLAEGERLLGTDGAKSNFAAVG